MSAVSDKFTLEIYLSVLQLEQQVETIERKRRKSLPKLPLQQPSEGELSGRNNYARWTVASTADTATFFFLLQEILKK